MSALWRIKSGKQAILFGLKWAKPDIDKCYNILEHQWVGVRACVCNFTNYAYHESSVTRSFCRLVQLWSPDILTTTETSAATKSPCHDVCFDLPFNLILFPVISLNKCLMNPVRPLKAALTPTGYRLRHKESQESCDLEHRSMNYKTQVINRDNKGIPGWGSASSHIQTRRRCN